jgi:hypothetical protein
MWQLGYCRHVNVTLGNGASDVLVTSKDDSQFAPGASSVIPDLLQAREQHILCDSCHPLLCKNVISSLVFLKS